MNIYITRNGQTYGPYSDEAVRTYVAEGSVLPTDLARSESMSNWIPLGQLLLKEAPPQPAAPPPQQPALQSQTPSAPALSGSDTQQDSKALVNYYVARGGQTYGPYSEETVRKYLAEGSIRATDMGRTEAMPNWVALGQLLGMGHAAAAAVGQSAAPPVYTPPLAAPAPYSPSPQYAAPAYSQSQPAGSGKIPPNLHWALILVIAMFTSGLFITVWAFIQANWIKNIDPASKAIRDLAIGVVFPLAGFAVMGIMLVTGGVMGSLDHLTGAVIGSLVAGFGAFFLLAIGGMIFTLKAFFGMKDSMERYYNSTEPINLRLSAIMTFFFNVIYLQYHMGRIADWKMTGVLRP